MDTSRSTALGVASASASSRSRYLPVDAATARLTPAAKPRFLGDRISVTRGNCLATTSGLPSLESLSTTMTSQVVSTDSRQRLRKAPLFQVTTSVETVADTAIHGSTGQEGTLHGSSRA